MKKRRTKGAILALGTAIILITLVAFIWMMDARNAGAEPTFETVFPDGVTTCGACHAFAPSSATALHTFHLALPAIGAGGCLDCHTGVAGAVPVDTSNCAVCHQFPPSATGHPTVGLICLHTTDGVTACSTCHVFPCATATPTPTPTPSPTPVGAMPCPSDEQVFWDGQNSSIVLSTDQSTAEPIAVTVKSGKECVKENGKVDIKLEASFDCPVDVELSVFTPGFDPGDIFYMDPDGNMACLTDKVYKSRGMDNDNQFKNLIFFKTDVLEVNEDLSEELPPGLYLLTLGVTPHRNGNQHFYRWVVYFIVP